MEIKIGATKSEAASVRIAVMGRYFVNWPASPVQNGSGKDTPSVVAGDAMIGQAIRLAAKA